MPKELDFENLRHCINHYQPIHLFIRDCGGIREDGKYSCQGKQKVNENLENRKLDFKKNKSGLHMIVDFKEVFHFPLKDYDKGFSIGYKRIELTDEGFEREIALSHGINPYNRSFPEPKESMFRTILDDHLMEISFRGRIDLRFHSWWHKPDFAYWTICKN